MPNALPRNTKSKLERFWCSPVTCKPCRINEFMHLPNVCRGQIASINRNEACLAEKTHHLPLPRAITTGGLQNQQHARLLREQTKHGAHDGREPCEVHGTAKAMSSREAQGAGDVRVKIDATRLASTPAPIITNGFMVQVIIGLWQVSWLTK